MCSSRTIEIRTAEWPRDEPSARSFLDSYFSWLRQNTAVPASIREKDRAHELGSLATQYTAGSTLLLAWWNGQVVGSIAVHLLASRVHAAEVKRLYVAPLSRGLGMGRRLIQSAMQWAQDQGAKELLLDTLPAAMPEAVRLYQALGFEPTERYNNNSVDTFAFYRLGLE